MRKVMTTVVALVIGLAGLVSAAPASAQSVCGANVTVVYGDTLSRIASRCNTTVSALLAANPSISDANWIYVGQQLQLPQNGQTDRPSYAQLNIEPQAGPPGTTIEVSASNYAANTTVRLAAGVANSEFSRFESVRTDAAGRVDADIAVPATARPGTEWVIAVQPMGPGAGSESRARFTVTDTIGRQGATYVIQPGDTLYSIAQRFGTTVDAIVAANSSIRDVNLIYVGDRIQIPGREPPTFTSVDIALIAMGQGEIGCQDGVVMVERDIDATQSPLTAALRELLSIKDRMYGQSGLYNALHRTDLHISDIQLDGGAATIRLEGEYQIGGTCDAPRVAAQLRQTALQFATIDQVNIYVNGTPLDQLLSQR